MTNDSINSNDYVQRTPEGGWRVAGTRVSLDSVLYAFWEGKPPEAIVLDFPSLSLEQVYGAVAYYLGHQEMVDRYLVDQNARWEDLRRQSESRHGPLLLRIRSQARHC